MIKTSSDIVLHKDGTLNIVYMLCKTIKEFTTVFNEGIYIIPLSITELIKNPITFYSKFIDVDSKPCIHALYLDPDYHKDFYDKIDGLKDAKIVTTGIIYFNKCCEDENIKTFYMLPYLDGKKLIDEKEYKVNMWYLL